MAKDEAKAEELDSVLAHLAASLRLIAILLQPVMTHAPKEIFTQLGLPLDNMAIKEVDYFVKQTSTVLLKLMQNVLDPC